MEKLIAEVQKELRCLEVDARAHREADGELLSSVYVCCSEVSYVSLSLMSKLPEMR